MSLFQPTTESDCSAPKLTPSELASAARDLIVRNHDSSKYPKINRKFVDPVKSGEPRFALLSFIPSKDAKPDSDNFYGFIKIRGAFYTEDEAAARAQEIIENVDSTNSIYISIVGHPYPVTTKGMSCNITEIDVQKKTEKTISENVRAKRNEEKRIAEEMQQKRDELFEDVASEASDEDKYITNRVKLAHLRANVIDYIKTIAEWKNAIIKTKNTLKAADSKYESIFMDKYLRARRKANIPESTDLDGFMKYIALPIEWEGDEDTSAAPPTTDDNEITHSSNNNDDDNKENSAN